MTLRRTVLIASVGFSCACAYYNGIYNAEGLYEEAERLRLSGADSLARARYEDVVRKAAKGYREDTMGPWADDALYLIGRARLRMGELSAATAALSQAAQQTSDEQIRLGATLYLGAALIRSGNAASGAGYLNQALQGLREGPELAEAHLLRAGVLIEAGAEDVGWWDLDRAAELDSGLRVAAAMERVRWGVRRGNVAVTREGVRRLLSYPEAAVMRDSVVTLFWWAAERLGAEEMAAMIGNSKFGWGRTGRGDALLARAGLLHAAGDTAAARQQATSVAGGFGEAAAEARILLAEWSLSDAGDLSGLDYARRILLPSEEHPEVAELLAALEETAALTALGLEEPLAWFAAAEVARDALRAPLLARGLFLAYAAGAPSEPWAPKALLAAVSVSSEEGDRAWLRGRLESEATSPYVLAAHGDSAPGIDALEEELSVRLAALRGR
jgi:hypothetical protein